MGTGVAVSFHICDDVSMRVWMWVDGWVCTKRENSRVDATKGKIRVKKRIKYYKRVFLAVSWTKDSDST